MLIEELGHWRHLRKNELIIFKYKKNRTHVRGSNTFRAIGGAFGLVDVNGRCDATTGGVRHTDN